jgi:His-Xaa-Ser system radical SAM maturase HxsC
MKYYQATPLSNESSIIGIATKNKKILNKTKYILIAGDIKTSDHGYKAILTSSTKSLNSNKIKNIIYNIPKFWLDSLAEGDIINIETNGLIKILWEIQSIHNIIMITNECNCLCRMCPQPLDADPSDLHEKNLKILHLVKNNSPKIIALTGGEPTLYIDRCLDIIKLCKNRFPSALLSLLTNGRLLTIANIKKLLSLNHNNLLFCIPIHADNSIIHDLTSNCPGSFNDTVSSIQNLAIFQQKIQLRIVITKYNYKRLQNISEFIYRNFPFCIDIAFMGMEICSSAYENKDEVWIDPYDYAKELGEAVKHLHQRNMKVSIYNIPFCLIPQNYWRFVVDSISGWKKGFIEKCNECKKKINCPGLFLTSRMQSKYIQPLINLQ